VLKWCSVTIFSKNSVIYSIVIEFSGLTVTNFYVIIRRVFSFQISAVHTHNSLVFFRTAILLSNCRFTDQNLVQPLTPVDNGGACNIRGLWQRRCSGFRSSCLSHYVVGWRVASFRRIVMASSLGPSSQRRISGPFKIPGILPTQSQHNNPIYPILDPQHIPSLLDCLQGAHSNNKQSLFANQVESFLYQRYFAWFQASAAK
jgi:hypothetical protein